MVTGVRSAVPARASPCVCMRGECGRLACGLCVVWALAREKRFRSLDAVARHTWLAVLQGLSRRGHRKPEVGRTSVAMMGVRWRARVAACRRRRMCVRANHRHVMCGRCAMR